jgi:predicted DNA-binding protein (MmcQ/YjbR family)
MDMAGFDLVCGQMKASTLVIQWKGSHVWKVGGKMFAVTWGRAPLFACSVKASDMARQAYAGHPGIIPAPYLARAGWLHIEDGALPDSDIADMIRVSHLLVIAGMPKKLRVELGFA